MRRIQIEINRYKTLISHIVPRIGVLLIMALCLFLFSSLLTKMLFVNRLDDTQVVALKCSFKIVPFKWGNLLSDISGERITILNVTIQTQTHYLYSKDFTSEEIKRVGAFEKDGQIYLVLLPLEVEEGKQYVTDGKFLNFYRSGTTQKMPVLFVENYREFGLLDEFVLENKTFLSHIIVILWTLTSACILLLIGSIIWVPAALSEEEG